jgi:uncharacterized protein (TIGR04255 family)
MRIETSKRVVYEHNPLAEVVCQIQFGKQVDLSDVEKLALRGKMEAAGYPVFSEEISFGFSQQISVNGTAEPIAFPQVRVDHFSTEDGVWRVSIAGEFVALTCLKYSGWDKFLPRLLEAVRVLVATHPKAQPSRLGLRYKDVIERESVGLTGTPWHEVINPFLLGPLAPNALAEGQTPFEAEVGTFLSQTLLRLDHCMLLLQSSILSSTDGQRRAFLIDADFYNDSDLQSELLENADVLATRLEGLHASAGALFRRGITEKLHHALRPSN